MKNEKISFKYKCLFKKSINSFLINKGYSENNIFYLIFNENVKINNKVVKSKNEIIPFNSLVEVTLNDEVSTIPLNTKPVNIVYEDDYILIVNKAANEDVEPTRNNYYNNLACKVNNYFNKNNIKSKVHLVNRLDKVTSGLIIIAKNQYIKNLFSKVKIIKKYKAFVDGKVNKKGMIKVKIKKDDNSIKRIVCDDGKLCLTKYKLISFSDNKSLVDIRLYTGRTHQIRVSFAFINHPLSGDHLYNQNHLKNSFYLNAYYLKFKHPMLKKKILIKI